MNRRVVSGLLVLACLAIAASPAHALSHPQTTGVAATKQDMTYSTDLNRAKNLARQAAETENGGVIVYSAEPSMHGPASESPYVDNGDGSWTFTFRGGTPGSEIYDIETVVMVDRATWTVTVLYNGPVR